MSIRNERDGETEDGNAIFWSGPHGILVTISDQGLKHYKEELAQGKTVRIIDTGNQQKDVPVQSIWIVGEPPQI